MIVDTRLKLLQFLCTGVLGLDLGSLRGVQCFDPEGGFGERLYPVDGTSGEEDERQRSVCCRKTIGVLCD